MSAGDPNYEESPDIEDIIALLRPFKKLADQLDKFISRESKPDDWPIWGFNSADLTYGDFRKVKAFFDEQGLT